MARDVGCTQDLVWFVPDVDDNRDDPEPVKALLQPMTAEDVRRYERELGKTKAGKQRNPVAAMHAHQRHIISERVKEVANYKCNGKAITNGQELFDLGESVVVQQVFMALQNLSFLNEGALGKSDSPSGS